MNNIEIKPLDQCVSYNTKDDQSIIKIDKKTFKVVKLNTSNPAPADVIQTYNYERLKDEAYRKRHSSILFHIGHGDTGSLQRGHDGTSYTVKGKQGAVFGATYCYTENTWGLCGTGITNETFMFGVKKDF